MLLALAALVGLRGVNALAQLSEIDKMDDKELEDKIDALCEKGQPEAVEPLMHSAMQRCEVKQNTRWMLKLVGQEIAVNRERRRGDHLDDAARLRAYAAKAWTPLRQLLMLDVYYHTSSNEDALTALMAADSLVRVQAADVCPEAKNLDEMNLFDFIIASIALHNSVERSIADEEVDQEAEEGEIVRPNGAEFPYSLPRPREPKPWLTDTVRQALLLPIDQFAASTTALPLPLEATRRLAKSAVKHGNDFSRFLAATLRVSVLNEARAATDSIERALVEELVALPAKSPQQKGLHSLALGNKRLNAAWDKLCEAPASWREADDVAKEALDLFRQAQKQLGGSPFANMAKETADNIAREQLAVDLQGQTPVGAPIPIYIGYRNVTSAVVKVYDAGETLELRMPQGAKRGDIDACLGQLKVVLEHKVALPTIKARLEGTVLATELQGLPAGNYVVAIYNPKSKKPEHAADVETLKVSDIALDLLQLNQNSRLLISNVADGEPMADAKTNQGAPDKDGWLSVKLDDKQLTATRGNDKFVANDRLSRWWRISDNPPATPRLAAQLLTDRNIFRPGQKVDVKVYLYKAWQDHTEAARKTDVTVRLRGDNGKELAAQSLTTGRFGTASTILDIPSDVLKGGATVQAVVKQHSVERVIGSRHIRIEDFKRTDNTLSFNPFKEVMVPGQTVCVSGSVTSAAGLPVSQAQGTWIVRAFDEVIANGTCQTDEVGNFQFNVEAKDFGEDIAAVDYSINVKFTDNRGETTENDTRLKVLRSGVTLAVDGLEGSDHWQGSPLTATLRVENGNGQPATKPLEVRLLRCADQPELRRGLRQNCDTVVGASTLDAKPQEPQRQEVWKRKLSVEGREALDLAADKLASGLYRLETTTEGLDGKPVVASADFRVLPDEGAAPNLHRLELWVPDSVVAGKPLTVKVASGFGRAAVTVVVVQRGRVLASKVAKCRGDIQTLDFALKADSRDGESVTVYALTHGLGESHSEQRDCRVARPVEPLDLKLTTFRDCSQPGATEKWTLTSNANDDIELCASIYDTRLDKYVCNSWRGISFGPVATPNTSRHRSLEPDVPSFIDIPIWHSGVGGQDCDSRQRWLLSELMMSVSYNSDLLESYYGPRYGGMLYARSMAAPRMKGLAMTNGIVEEEALEDGMLTSAGPMEEAMMVYDTEMVDAEEAAEEPSAAAGAVDKPAPEPPLPRSNFSETVIFLPELTPDKQGKTTVEFTLPDNLTEYEFRCLGHDTTMRSTLVEQRFRVRKALNVRLGLPRFLTEGDKLTLTADVAVTDSTIRAADVTLTLVDPDGLVKLPTLHAQRLDLANGAAQAKWDFTVPDGLETLRLTAAASAANHTDAEQTDLPIAKRCIEVQENQCFTLFGKGEKHLKNPYTQGRMSSLQFNYTSNTFIEVLRALPTLSEGWVPNADTYLGHVETAVIAQQLKKDPVIMKAVEYLRKHPDEQPTIAEAEQTPWLYLVRQMRNHDKAVVKLMSGHYAERTFDSALSKLYDLQLSNGGIAWFAGMEASPFLTASVVRTLGDLVELGLISPDDYKAKRLRQRAVPYLDVYLDASLRGLERAEKSQDQDVAKGFPRKPVYLSPLDLEVLGARISADPRLEGTVKELVTHVKLNWKYPSIDNRIDVLDILRRAYGGGAALYDIVQNLKENLVVVDENTLAVGERSWWGRRTQIVAEARLIMLMRREHQGDCAQRLVNHLVSVKRGEAWPDAQSTSRAVLALLDTGGPNGIGDQTDVVKIATQSVTCTVEHPRVTLTLDANQPPKQAVVTKGGTYPTWGSWQRTLLSAVSKLPAEGSDKLSITRKVEVRELSGDQERWKPFNDEHPLAVGSEVRVTLEFSNEEPLSFVRIVDRRAASLEPLDMRSGYRGWWFWRWFDPDDLIPPHYLCIADRDCEFFIDHLQRGSHRITYRLRVTHAGLFQAGYADAVCLYDPEIRSHSAGSALNVNNR